MLHTRKPERWAPAGGSDVKSHNSGNWTDVDTQQYQGRDRAPRSRPFYGDPGLIRYAGVGPEPNRLWLESDTINYNVQFGDETACLRRQRTSKRVGNYEALSKTFGDKITRTISELETVS